LLVVVNQHRLKTDLQFTVTVLKLLNGTENTMFA